MGTSLNGLTPSATYSGLIKFGDNSAIGASLKYISDGDGNDTLLAMSTTSLNIGATNITARVGIKGSGSTSGTKSISILNSLNVESFIVYDNGSVANHGKSALTGNSSYGLDALLNNSTGSDNTGYGFQALRNTTGSGNTGIGNQALLGLSSGSNNTAIGYQSAYQSPMTGGGNSFLGYRAGFYNGAGNNNVAIGNFADSSGYSGCIVLGKDATATASNQFVVGSTGTNAGSVTTESNLSSKVWNVIINGVAQKILLA